MQSETKRKAIRTCRHAVNFDITERSCDQGIAMVVCTDCLSLLIASVSLQVALIDDAQDESNSGTRRKLNYLFFDLTGKQIESTQKRDYQSEYYQRVVKAARIAIRKEKGTS